MGAMVPPQASTGGLQQHRKAGSGETAPEGLKMAVYMPVVIELYYFIGG